MKKTVNVWAWTALTTAGLAGGLVAGLLLGMALEDLVNAMIVTAAVTCCVGAVLGTSQAFGLRGLLRAPIWWVPATLVGVGVGLAAGVVLVEQLGILLTGTRPNIARIGPAARGLSMLVVGLITGACMGAAQTFVLRRQAAHVRHWLAITSVGMAVAFGFSSLLVDLSRMKFASLGGVIAFVILSGITFGVLTSRPFRKAG